MGSIFRKGSADTSRSSRSSEALSEAGAEMLRQGAPLRSATYGQLGGFLKTGRIPGALTGDIGTQEQELASARQGILNSGVRGGQLRTDLAQLPLNRLAMRDQLRSSVFNTALGAGQNSYSTAAGGMGTAASNLNSLGQGRIAQNQLAKQGIGTMGGQAKGMMSM